MPYLRRRKNKTEPMREIQVSDSSPQRNVERIMVNARQYVTVPIRRKPPHISQQDWDKLGKINDKIAVNITYDQRRAKYLRQQGLQTPQETLQRRSGVCMDFAALFEKMARQQGYTVRSIHSDQLNHAWNEVKLNGRWWIVDTAWNVPSSDFKATHQRSNPNLIRRYFLTSVEEELALKREKLLPQTHHCSDAETVDYEKTFEARDIYTRISKHIDKFNELIREHKHTLKRYNANVETFNRLRRDFHEAENQLRKERLNKKLIKGERILTEQKAQIAALESQIEESNRHIERLSGQFKELERAYPLAIHMTISSR